MPLQLFGDFSFVGGSDETANPYQDAQRTINWYVEVSPSRGAKMPAALLGTPGLVPLAVAAGGGIPPTYWTADSSIVTADSNLPIGVMDSWPTAYGGPSLPVRCLWVLPGAEQALAVIGSNIYLVTQGAIGTNGYPSIQITKIGSIATTSGIVRIRDNGTGGVAVIVDGSSAGYFYVYGAGGSNVGPVGTFTQITDPNFFGADTVAFIDGWWIFNKPGSAEFYTPTQPYGTTFGNGYFALKDAWSHNLVAVIENKEELWLIGEMTTEIWYDAGGEFFPFQRLVGTLLQVGCSAAQSVAQLSQGGDDSLIWLGKNIQGDSVIVRTQGFSWQVISTPAVSAAIASYPVISDAVAYVYQADAHEFYVITFPTADRTWVYDATLPPDLAWHERLSFDPYADTFHRHRSNCYMHFAGMHIVGDYQNGVIYQMTRSAYTDAGWPIKAVRRSPYIWNAQSRERVFMSQLQVDFRLGQGTAYGQGSNPQAYLRISRDYGATYGSSVPAPMGAQGQTTNRCIWRRLGWSRGAVAQIEVIDPVNRDIAGVTLRAAGP